MTERNDVDFVMKSIILEKCVHFMPTRVSTDFMKAVDVRTSYFPLFSPSVQLHY